ncbi:MAG: helix-turn-helix transcriptional regulator [Chitinophagaceae bacterium]
MEIIHIDSIADYNTMCSLKTLHPLVTVNDYSKQVASGSAARPARTFNFSVYGIFLKEFDCGELRYGRGHYDYQEGSMVFMAPGQVWGVSAEPEGEDKVHKGWALLFHPDFLHGTHLSKSIKEYSFFSYATNEALHLSDDEKQIITDCFIKVEYELHQAIDKYSKGLIASNIELLLNYCMRFYNRQFITRDNVNRGILEKFEALLNDYFSTDKQQSDGLPTVAYCATALHLSTNYFGDLIKKETGKTAQEYIQAKVIELAKERIFDNKLSISEVAYYLGFKYPHHFTRLFKQKTGKSPTQYRNAFS